MSAIFTHPIRVMLKHGFYCNNIQALSVSNIIPFDIFAPNLLNSGLNYAGIYRKNKLIYFITVID